MHRNIVSSNKQLQLQMEIYNKQLLLKLELSRDWCLSKTVCLQACLLAPTLHIQGLTYQKAVSAVSEPSQQLSTPDADAEEPTGFLLEHP